MPPRPLGERQPAAAPQCFAQVAECRRRVIEEHHTEAAQHHVEDPGLERVHLDVDDFEPGISDASGSGEPARLGHLDPGKVRAQGVPAAGGACREDSRLTAAAPDVENVLPVLDRRGGQQPRPQRAQHPLMPLTLLDELPPAGSVPVLGLLGIHRHESHATSPGKAAEWLRYAARRGRAAGWAADDGAALVFHGETLSEVVASRPEAAGYRVIRAAGSQVAEQRIPARYLRAAARL